MFETPILLITFNRPDTTQQTFNVIRSVRPRHLFVAADGPRPHRPDDAERCAATRAIIRQVDWDCNVRTLFRDENRGCGHGPAEAITWFFGQVEAGIVLEDDCLPDPSFFPFCETLLKQYRNDPSVAMITGTNALMRWNDQHCSYFFSYMAQSLGWASWRRAWQAFDYRMSAWTRAAGRQTIRLTLERRAYFEHFQAHFDAYQRTQPDDVWDFQWLFARWLHGGRTIVPARNLIRNIGFNADATHSFYENDLLANLPLSTLPFPLTPPARPLDKLFDWYLFERFYNHRKRPLWKKIVLKLIRVSKQTH